MISSVQLTDAYLPVLDGVTTTVRAYARWLGTQQIPTRVVAPRQPGPDESTADVLRYRSMPLPRRPPYRLGLPQLDPRLWRRLALHPAGVIHCHAPFASAVIARRIRKRWRAPVVATFHSKYRDDLLGGIPVRCLVDWRIRRVVRFLDSCDEVWIPSRSSVSTLRDYGYEGPVEVVPNGIDLTSFEPTPELVDQGNEVLGSAPNVPLVLYVGQMVREKNLAFLVDAMADARAQGSQIAVALVGEGYARDEIRDRAVAAGLGESLLMPGAVRDRRALAACYARADLFVFPSIYDTQGLVVREAAALQTPSLLLEGADAGEGIRDGVNGFIAPLDPTAYAAVIRRLLARPHLLRRVGEQARSTLCVSWERVVEDVASRYRDLAGRFERRQAAVHRAA